MNSAYGQLLMRVEDFVNSAIHFDEQKFNSSANNTRCTGWDIWQDDKEHTEKKTREAASPKLVGFVVLEMAKLHMQRTLRKLTGFWGDRMELIFTDTDSYYILVETETLLEDLAKINELHGPTIDRWELCKSFPELEAETAAEKGKLGLLKIEHDDHGFIKEIVALGPKTHSTLGFHDYGTEECRKIGSEKHKGIPKRTAVVPRSELNLEEHKTKKAAVVARDSKDVEEAERAKELQTHRLNHEKYVESYRRAMAGDVRARDAAVTHVIQSKGHEIRLGAQIKNSVSANNFKVHQTWRGLRTTTLPFGHPSTLGPVLLKPRGSARPSRLRLARGLPLGSGR